MILTFIFTTLWLLAIWMFYGWYLPWTETFRTHRGFSFERDIRNPQLPAFLFAFLSASALPLLYAILCQFNSVCEVVAKNEQGLTTSCNWIPLLNPSAFIAFSAPICLAVLGARFKPVLLTCAHQIRTRLRRPSTEDLLAQGEKFLEEANEILKSSASVPEIKEK